MNAEVTVRAFVARIVGALIFVVVCCAGYADASPITVNKQFAPNVVNLGGASSVTVTLQNNNTSAAATAAGFTDDIGSMAGGGIVNGAFPTTNTCGGTVNIVGNVVTLSGGTVPRAPNSTTPGSCSVTFGIYGNKAGNSVNTILASSVNTSLGGPPGNAQQTLNVQSANIVVGAGPSQTVLVGATAPSPSATTTYTIANPTGTVDLTNVAFPINVSTANPYTFTVTSATLGGATGCAGTAVLPPTGLSGTIQFSGATIPAGATCTVSVSTVTNATTVLAPATVNFTLPSSGITSTQGITNSNAASNQARYVVGNPTITKAFAPNAIQPGGTSVLTIRIANGLTSQTLDNSALTDNLPAGLTVSNPPSATTSCPGGAVAAANGATSVALSGATIPANGNCTITVTVTSAVAATYTNTIPASGPGAFTSTQVNNSSGPASAQLLVTGPGGGISTNKSASVGQAGPNTPFKITLQFNSIASGAFTGGTFSDTLPTQGSSKMVVVNDASHLPTFTGCGATPAITAVAGTQLVSGSNLAIAAGGNCQVGFYAQFQGTTPGTVVPFVNTLSATNVSFLNATSNPVAPSNSPSATIKELPVFTLSNYSGLSAPQNGKNLARQAVTVQAQIIDNDPTGTLTDTNFNATFRLNAGQVQLAPTPNFTFGPGCPTGLSAANVTPGTNGESFVLSISAPTMIAATCTFTYDVIDEGGLTGTFTPGFSNYTSNLSGGLPSGNFTGTNAVTFSTTNINITKAFSPNQIQSGSTSVAGITVSVAGVAGFAQTTAQGVSVPDTLPANVTFASPPNVTFSAGCQQTGQPAPTYTIAGSTITASSISLLTVGAPTPCTVGFSVTSTVLGAPVNVIHAGDITSTSGITNSQNVSASLIVASGVALQKTFLSSTLQIGGTDYVRFLLTNSAVTMPGLSGGTLTDTLPAQLVLATTALGPAQPGDPPLCGGTVSGAAGSSLIQLTGITIPPLVGAVPGQCVLYVGVGASTTAAPGPVTNTVGVGGLSIGGYGNQQASSATNTLTAAPSATITKAFAPATIAAGGSSALTITVSNAAAGAAPLTALALTDTLPANVQIAPAPAAATTCTGGTVAATAGGTTVALTGGALAANASCTITVSVTSSTGGIYANTIPAAALMSLQGASNTAPASATLNVGNVSAVSLTKAFVPAAIAVNGSSTLTIALANTAAAAVPLTAIAVTDSLPANVTVAPTPNAATTCTGGSATAVAGGTTVALSGASLAANATCTISVAVTSAATGIYVNAIPANALTDAQGSTNTATAEAALNVGNSSGVGIAKTFAPAAIAANGTSALTITLVNSAASAVALSAMGLTDALPANLKVAATPNASTTCGAGSVNAPPGATSVTLAGGTLAANASCTIGVTVTSATSGIYRNTIPPNALTDAQNSTNASPAAALLNVGNTSSVTVAKSFAPALIAPGATSTLMVSLANTSANAVALSALSLTDPLPPNVTVATVPNAATTCTGGTVTVTAGSSNVTLSGASLTASATCTITVTVTGTVPGGYVNTIPASAVNTAQGATNATPAQATLTIGQPSLSVTKTSNPSAATVSPGETITYTIAVRNGGTQTETNARIADTLANATLVPGSVTVNAIAAPDGIVTAGQSFGSLGVGATTTIVYNAIVNASAPAAAQVTNSATVSGDQPCSGATCTATSPANVVQPPVLAATKVIDGQQSESVLPGQTIAYGITVANTGAGPSINTTVIDALPVGLTLVAGTITLNAATAAGATTSGQTISVPVNTIAAGASAVIAFKATVGATMGTAANTVSVSAAGLARAVQSNAATAHEVPPTIAVTKTATATTVTSGDRVDYAIVATPLNGVAYGAATVADTLPDYEVYAPGTARVGGKPQEPSVQGHTLTWTLPSLTAAVTFSYSTAIAPGVPQNSTLTNTVNVAAVGPGGAGFGRGSASASVLVVGSTFGSCYPITGRAYLDANGSGHFADPDVGLAHVNIYLDNGESVTTDSTGRYDFPCVHPGMHALRLDAESLPAGVRPYDDRNIDSEKSTRRLVHRIYDTTIIEDINFALSGTLATPPARTEKASPKENSRE